MEWILICNYDPCCQAVVLRFVEETAKALGATEREIYTLGIAAEEAVLHILENVPAESRQERFEIRCLAPENGIEFQFGNLGRPINLQTLPQYSSEYPEESIDGLPFFLMNHLVDRFAFVNRGKDGWCTVIFKRLAGLGSNQATGIREEEIDPKSCAGEKLLVRRAVPEDAPAITELAYQTYHYTYPRDIIYFPERLAEALHEEQIVSFIALNPKGVIVGQMALFADPNCRRMAEIGALMVHQDYRLSRGLLHILKSTQRYTMGADASFDFYITNQITEHVIAQRMSGLFHFHPMALKLSYFDGLIADSSSAIKPRINLLYLVVMSKPIGRIRLCVPPRHASIARTLFADMDCELDWGSSEASDTCQKATRLNVLYQREQAHAVLSVLHVGSDLVETIRRALLQLMYEDLKTIYVKVPLWEPGSSGLDHSAPGMQLFFSGFVAESPERWSILYTRIVRPRLDFSHIELLNPAAVALKEHVKSCYRLAMPD